MKNAASYSYKLNRYNIITLFQKILLCALLIFSINVKGQLVVKDNISLATVIANLFGPGVTVSNVAIVGKPIQYGTFTATGTGLGLNSGLLITNGSADSVAQANNNSTSTSSSDKESVCVGTVSTDACITTLSTGKQHDPCIITFDIVPSCDTLTMQYVFGSEEYPTFVGTKFNDVFGFFINGPKPSGGTYSCFNVATLPGSTTPVSINTVNASTNSSYYRDNTASTATTHKYIGYNGLTASLTAYIPVTPCQSYTMEIAVTDIGDCNYDSGVFLQYQGLQCAADQTLAVLPKNTTVCAGQPVVLTASGISGGGYTWSPATGLSATTGTTVTATPTTNIQYVVSATTSCLTEHDTVSITISSATKLTVNTTSTNNGCIPCSATANVTSVSGGSGGPYSYSWLPGNMTSQAVTNLCTGSYTVVVHDNGTNCPAPNDSTKITIINAGGGLTFARDSTASACTANNGTASITMTSGTAPYTYKWSNGGTSSNITGVGAGSYCVNVVDAKGCKDSACIIVPSTGNVATSITGIVNEPCFGDSSGTATANVTGGTGPFTYAWNNGETTSTATILKGGSYTITVTDANGCIGTSTTKVTQPTALQLSASAIQTSCNAKCDGQLIVIPKQGTAPYSYLWSNANTAASQLNACAGTYSIVVTDANGCTKDTTGMVVTQPTAVQGTTTTTSAQCGQADGGACVTATGGTGAYTYAWNTTPAQTTTCATNITSATYSVIIQDANKCPDTVQAIVPNLAGDTAEVLSSTNILCYGTGNGTVVGGGKGGTAPYTYSWSTTPIQTSATATGLFAGNYTVTVKDNTGCVSTASVTITQPAAIVVTASPAQIICTGDSAFLTATAVGGTAPYTYTWTPTGSTGSSITVKPASTTTYSVIAVDSNKCVSNVASVTIKVNPPLTVSVSPNQSACLGGSVSFTATAGGGDGTYTYAWAPGGYTSATITVSPTTTTVYTVIIKDACGTAPVKDSVTATVNEPPVVAFTADTFAGCSKLCVTFKNTTTNGATFVWSYGDGGGSNSQNPLQYCYATAGVYTVSLLVTSSVGCKDSLTIPNMISVYSHPVAAFTYNPQPINILEPTVYFKDQSTDNYGPIASWLWAFGDLLNGTSKVQNPNYTYADTGVYCVTEIIANKYGCLDSARNCLDVQPDFTFYIPNAFSPNSDGQNDIFGPIGTYVCGYSMYIFDRWGQELYHTTDMTKGWDGKVGGAKAEEDTYIYQISAIDCAQHNEHQYVGRVTLVR